MSKPGATIPDLEHLSAMLTLIADRNENPALDEARIRRVRDYLDQSAAILIMNKLRDTETLLSALREFYEDATTRTMYRKSHRYNRGEI